jgi:hypothetical protein
MLNDARANGEPSSLVVGAIQDRSAVPLLVLPCTVTVTGTLVIPPGPVHRSLKMLSTVSGPTTSLPESGLEPDQSRRASQESASLVDQVSVVKPPEFTVVGLALRLTVGRGAAATVTVADWPALPPGPVQVKVYVLVAVSGPTAWLPFTALKPDQAPPALQVVASVDIQVRVEEPLYAIDAGLALSETVGVGGGGGASTVTVTDWPALPPAPLQTRVNVVVAAKGPTASLPDVALRPDQPSKASQLVAPVDDQLSVVPSLRPTLVGLAINETVGAGGGAWFPTVTVTAWVVMPPIPRQARM